MKPKVLVFVAHYLPSFKSGGPVRSVSSIVESLGHEIDFYIVTRDRDALDREPFSGITVDEWNTVGFAKVFYGSPNWFGFRNISDLVKSEKFDAVYTNSFFEWATGILPLLVRRNTRNSFPRTIIAPRGELSSAALGLSRVKKQIFLFAASIFGLHKGVQFQATSSEERDEVQLLFGGATVWLAQNLPNGRLRSRGESPDDASHAALRLIFLSRITPKKNLLFALRVLSNVRQEVIFNIYGPVRDDRYWDQCTQVIKSLPPNVKVHHHGAVTPEEVGPLLWAHHAMFLPTLGENYGHAIAESFLVGTPVLISDKTPWRGLQTLKMGWDLALDDEGGYIDAIEKLAGISTEERNAWRRHISSRAAEVLGIDTVIEDTRKIFLPTNIKYHASQ